MPSFNMDELRELAELVNEHGFTDFEFENENIRVRLSKTTCSPQCSAAAGACTGAAACSSAGCRPQLRNGRSCSRSRR